MNSLKKLSNNTIWGKNLINHMKFSMQYHRYCSNEIELRKAASNKAPNPIAWAFDTQTDCNIRPVFKFAESRIVLKQIMVVISANQS